MTDTNLRVIHGARGTLPEDAPFAEFCAAAMRAVSGRDRDGDFFDERKHSGAWAYTLEGRIESLEAWTSENLPAWSVAQKPSRRRDAIRKPILSAVDAWTGQCVLLTGLTGAGKTTAAAHLLLSYWESSIRRAVEVYATKQKRIASALWAKSPTLERARREHPLGQGGPEIVTRSIGTNILVIDDLGQEANRGETVFFDVLDARYENQLPTIVTTGLTVHELGERYGTNLVRRLAHHGRGFRLGEAW